MYDCPDLCLSFISDLNECLIHYAFMTQVSQNHLQLRLDQNLNSMPENNKWWKQNEVQFLQNHLVCEMSWFYVTINVIKRCWLFSRCTVIITNRNLNCNNGLFFFFFYLALPFWPLHLHLLQPWYLAFISSTWTFQTLFMPDISRWKVILSPFCLQQGGYVFGLFVCRQDYRKAVGLIFKKDKFWSASESQRRCTNYFSLWLTLGDGAFGLGGINAKHFDVQ